MTNKERIIELSKHYEPIEVAEMCNVSAGYVYRVLREVHPKTLTLENYLNAIISGITRKDDLAAFLGVERTTLYRFEQRYMAKETIGQILYFLNGDLEEAKKAQAMTKEEAAELAQLPTLSNVIDDLETMHKIVGRYKDLTTVHTKLFNKLSEALNALKC